MKAFVATALLVLVASRMEAQNSSSDSTFRRARRLVAEGNGLAGRAMVDSLLRRADEGSTEYGNALYWHGALAETAADAERDYRKVIVEYPTSAYVDDALLAIAELEQARGDRAAALQHLQRFVREHPVASPSRGIAAFAAARLAFEQRDTKTACGLIGDARASTPTTNVEMLNQIEYYGNKCPTSAIAEVPAPARDSVVPKAPTRAVTKVDSSAFRSRARADSVALAGRQRADSVALAIRQRGDSARAAKIARADSIRLRKSADSAASAALPVAAPAKKTIDSPPPAPAAKGIYTIQVAAYNTREDADRLVTKLKGKDVTARVSGTEKPFRVRLDFFPTRAAALAEVASLKARGIIGFVTEEQPPVKGIR